jgi:hypothetical protein
VAAIAQVFTIGYVANQLGEDEDWLFELSIDVFLEDCCLCVYGVGQDGVPAFAHNGIDSPRQIITDERAAAAGQTRQIGRPVALTVWIRCVSAPSGIHRSLKGELLAIIEAAVEEERPATPADILTEVRRLELRTPSEAAAWIRANRDGR